MPKTLPIISDIIAASMSISAGVDDDVLADQFTEGTIERAMSSEYSGVGFHSAIRAMATEAGISHGSHLSGADYANLADELEASQGWSGLRLSSVNENVMNRSVAQRFEIMDSVIPMVAEEVPARDFRPHKAYRLYGTEFFQKLGTTAEIQHLKFSDTGFSNEVDTSAGMVTIPRKAIINDDIGIFAALSQSISDTAFHTRERDFCFVLSDPTLWRTATAIAPDGGTLSANSIAAGGSSAFGVSSLEALDDVLVTQKDRGGMPIRGVNRKILLTQSGSMAREAKRIHNSEHLQDQASGVASGEATAKQNSMFGELERRASTQWLAHEALGSRASSTSFFLFADPAVEAFIQVLYLGDQRTPKVETERAAFNTLGQQMRGVWDYGIAVVNDCGAVYSPGE